MGAAGVKADTATYSSLIDALGKAGWVEEAEEVFAAVGAAGAKADTVTYSSLIDALGKAGRAEEAQEVFAAMDVTRIGPNIRTCTSPS